MKKWQFGKRIHHLNQQGETGREWAKTDKIFRNIQQQVEQIFREQEVRR